MAASFRRGPTRHTHTAAIPKHRPHRPRTGDFFVKLIELRIRKTDDELDDKRRKTGYKVVSLSGVYGTAAETNPSTSIPTTRSANYAR